MGYNRHHGDHSSDTGQAKCSCNCTFCQQQYLRSVGRTTPGTWEAQLAALSLSLQERDNEVNQLRMKVSILASVQEEANALRSKTAMLQSKCRECEQMASRVVEEAQHKDVALQRAHDAENELKRKIAWLENNVTNNYKHLEAENRSLQAQLDAACQERQQRIEAVERAEADFMRARAEASRLEKHAADLHNQIAQVREEALQHQDGSKLRLMAQEQRMAAEKVALQNQIASLHDALRKAREEADAEKAAKLSAIQQHGGISSELKDLRARLEQMRQACQAEREKAEAELERQRQIAAIQRDQERTQMRELEAAIERAAHQMHGLAQQISSKDAEISKRDAEARLMTQQMDDLRKQFAALRDLHEREPSAAVAARHKSELDRAQQGARDAHGQLDRMNQQLDSEKEKARTMESAAQQAAKDVDGLYRQLSELKTYLVAEQKEAAAAIGDRENVIRVMRADIGDLQARVGADKAALNARDLDITRLKADLEASYDELQSERNSGAEKDREIGDMGKRLSGLHGELDSARNREAQLTDRIERLQATLGVKEDQLAKSNGMLADAKRNLDVSQAYGNKQASEVSRLESHAANLHSEISSLRKLLAELQAAKEGELQQMQRSSDEIQRQLCADRDHWKRVATEKEEQAAALQARTSDMERHIRSLRQEGKQNEEAIAAKEAELQETQAQLAEARHQLNLSQAAVADLEERIRRLRDQLSEAKRDADKQRLWYAEGLAAKDADIKQLQGGLSDLQRCLTAEQTLSRNLAADKEDQIARLERELDQERRVSQEALAVKEGEMADLKDFLASLRQQMARAETDAKDKGANVLRLQNQAADLDYRLSQQTKQLADRDAELGGLLERLSDLQLQLDTACLSSAEKDAQLQRLRAMLDDAQHGLEREKAQANQMAAYSNGEIQQLRQQLDQAERNARQAERENADSEKSLLAKINDLKDKLAEAQRRSASDMVAIEDLRKQVDALKQELERSRQAGARESAEAAARAQKDLQSLVKCASDQIAYMAGECARTLDKDPACAAKNMNNLDGLRQCLPDPLSPSMYSLRQRLQAVFEEVDSLSRLNSALQAELTDQIGQASRLKELSDQLRDEMADANGNIKSLRQLLSQKDDDLRDLRAHAAGCEDDLRRQLQAAQAEMMGLEDSMASAHRILSSVPGNNRSSGSPTAGLSRQMLKTELKDQASRVAAQCNSMNTQINEDAAEIARLTDMQRDRQHDLQRLERLVASEKAAASNAARDNQSLRSELEQLVRAHGKEVEELTLEVDKLRQAGDRKLNEASAMFQREHEEINTKLGHAMDAARLLVRYAIPANLTIKQLTFQKELLSKLGASYYKQLNTARERLEELHSQYCPNTRYTATARRMCGHARSVGVRLFRVAARHVIAARRIYRLANGYALEGSLQQLGRAIRAGGSLIRMLPDLPRNSDPTILAMSSMANSGGSQAEATAVHSILDMGPFPLASMLQRGVLIDSSPRHSAHWKVSIESVLQGISALLDAASNKMMYTEGEISSLRKSLGIAEAKKLASEEAAKDADARVALLMKRIEEESVEVRNKVSSESFRSAELIASLKAQLKNAEEQARVANLESKQTANELDRQLRVSGELRHKLSEIESNAMERNRQMDRNMDEMRTQLDMTGRLNARLQAVQDTQRHLKNEYISKSARPWTVPATDDASDDDDRQDSASESHSSVQRRDRMMQSANLLASKQAELKHLLKEKGRHDDMLRSELEPPRGGNIFISQGANARTAEEYGLPSGVKIHKNEWNA